MAKKYDPADIEDLVNNFDDDELQTLMGVFDKIDRLQVDSNGDAVWSGPEMDLIGRFQNLDDIGDADEDEESDDESDDADNGDEVPVEDPQTVPGSTVL